MLGARPTSVEALASSVPAAAWQTVSWDYGAGKKTSRFYRQRIHPAPRDYFHGKWPEPGERLLVDRPEDQAEPSHYWLSTLPADIAMQAFVRTAKLRWRSPHGSGCDRAAEGSGMVTRTRGKGEPGRK